MARYRLHCIGASGNSYKLALYLNCAGLDWEPVGVDFALEIGHHHRFGSDYVSRHSGSSLGYSCLLR